MILNIQIRKARPEDNEAVRDFAFEIMRSMGIEPDPENIDYALATFGQERGILSSEFVAVDGEQLIGCIILKSISPSVAEMTVFYVRSNYQGQGIGHKLIETLLSAAIEVGYKHVVLTTNWNMTAAISLYDSFGWVRQSKKPENGADYLYLLPFHCAP